MLQWNLSNQIAKNLLFYKSTLDIASNVFWKNQQLIVEKWGTSIEMVHIHESTLVIILLEIIRKQAWFETPKFNKRCNYIEMIRKEITWVEGVTNYNHKTTTCNKLIPNFKVFRCIQKLDRREWNTTQNHSNIYYFLTLK